MLGWPSEPAILDSPHEALRPRRIGRVEGGELLQRDPTSQLGLLREIDDRHPTAPDDAVDLEAADPPLNVLQAISSRG